MPGESAWIPHSFFKAKHSGDHVPTLECKIDLLGAKHPYNQFTVDISPSGMIILYVDNFCQCYPDD